MSTSFLSLVKRSSSWKKDNDSHGSETHRDGSGRSTPTSPLSPSSSLSSLPTNQPLLPLALHASALGADTPRSVASSGALPVPAPSSEPRYAGSSSSTALPSSSSPSKRPLLGMVRSSFARRHGKGVAQLDDDDDEPNEPHDRQSRRATSPTKLSTDSPSTRQPRPPSLDLSSSTFVLPSPRASPVPSQISLPPESPSEHLHEEEVIELQAFVDKKLWIEDRIEMLRGLPPIECFVVLMPTFRDGAPVPTDATSTLPTPEELDEMWAEQDRIEEEADRFDGGDLTRLRKMAKAASQKSLSVSDTDLLSITLSTLYLLDTLLHLLRARAETVDLLSLRLQWDALRFAVGKETEALERDVCVFVEGKGRWGLNKYDKAASPAGSSSPLLGTAGKECTTHCKDSSDTGSVRSLGGSTKVASRSQRYLLTQILELDYQAFHNRIASLRAGPVVQAGKMLDKMIDVASSVRSHQTKKKRSATSTSMQSLDSLATATPPPESEEDEAEDKVEDEGAVPEWFLDEMDRVDERVAALRGYEDLARESVRQWKFADQTFHTTRKLLNDSANLSSELSQAFLQHPTLIRSKAFTSRASAIVSELTLVPDVAQPSASSLFPRPTHASLASLPPANRTIASVLIDELAAAKDEARRAHKLAKEYTILVERVDQLASLRSRMDKSAGELEEATRKLEHGMDQSPAGQPIDLSTPVCLNPDSHAVYIVQFPVVSAIISSSEPSAREAIRQTATLVLTLRSAGGVDPNFKSSVEATSSRLESSLQTALMARETHGSRLEQLAEARSLDAAQKAAMSQVVLLKAALLARIEAARWTGIDSTSSAGQDEAQAERIRSLAGQVASLEAVVPDTVSSRLTRVSSSLGSDHVGLVSHLSTAANRVRERIGVLRELTRLLEAVSCQSDAMALVASEARACESSASELSNSISTAVAEAEQGSGPTEHTCANADQTLEGHIGSHLSRVRAFVGSLSGRIPFVASPSSSAALLAHPSVASATQSGSSPLTPPRSPAQPMFDTDLPASDPSSSIDLAALDALVRSDGNILAARLLGEAERLELRLHSIAAAREAFQCDRDADALQQTLVDWEASVARCAQSLSDINDRGTSTELTILQNKLLALQDAQSQAQSALSDSASTAAAQAVTLQASFGAYSTASTRARLDLPDVRRASHSESLESHARIERSSVDVLDRLARGIDEALSAIKVEEDRLVAEAEQAQAHEELQRRQAEAEAERVTMERANAEAREAELAAEKARMEEEEERRFALEQDRAQAAAREAARHDAAEKAARAEDQRRLDGEERNNSIAAQVERDLATEAARVRAAEERQQSTLGTQRARTISATLSTDANTPKSRSRTTTAVPFPSSSNLAADDVFGPVTPATQMPTSEPSSDAESVLERVSVLRSRIEALALPSATDPSATSTASLRHLPTVIEAARDREELDSIERDLPRPRSTAPADEQDALNDLRVLLGHSRDLLVKMELLASFTVAVTACDTSSSSLLDAIDEAASASRPVTPTSTDKTHDALRHALETSATTLEAAVSSSRTIVPPDDRVEGEVCRLKQALEELKEMAEDQMNPLSRLSRMRSPSVSSSYGGSMDGSVDGHEPQGSVRALSRSSSSASISSSRSTRSSMSRIPRSSSISHSLASVAASPTTSKPGRSRIPTSSSRPRIPSTMFKPPASVKTSDRPSPRSFSGPASSSPAVATSSTSRQPHYFAQTASSRERTLSTLSSTSTSTQVPNTPVRPRIPSTLARVSSPSPFQNPPTTPTEHARSTSTVSRYQYKRPSTASGSSRPFAEKAESEDRRRSSGFGTMPAGRSGSIRSKLDEEAGQSTPTKRTSLGGGAGTNVTPLPRKRYRAQKDHKLDRAVGRIVNALPVEIPIAPVVSGLDSESGKYWIGHPPKLCFCRILRSKTVMVRVGGGWVELSKFLRDHFGIDLLANTAATPVSVTQGSERWIRGGGTPLHTSAGAYIVPPSTPGPPPTSQLPPSTPNLTFPRNAQSPQLVYATPGHGQARRLRHSSLSPAIPSFTSPVLAQSVDAGAGSPGSPLVPLHIMRKAGAGEASPPAGIGLGMMMRQGSERRSMGVAGGLRSSIGGKGDRPHTMGRSFSGGSVKGEGKLGAPWRA